VGRIRRPGRRQAMTGMMGDPVWLAYLWVMVALIIVWVALNRSLSH